MQIILLLCLLLIGFNTSPLQAQDTIRVSTIRKPVKLGETGAIFYGYHTASTPDSLPADFFSKNLSYHTHEKHTIHTPAWLKAIVHNDTQDSTYLDFNFLSADVITTHIFTSGTEYIVETGPYLTPHKWPFHEQPGLIPLSFQPGQTSTLYFRLWSEEGRPFLLKNAYIQTRSDSLLESVLGYRSFVARTEFNGFFLGAITFTMLFFLFIYFKVRDRVYLYYSLYLLGAALYALVVKSLPYSNLARLAYLDFQITYKLGEPVQYLFFAFYLLFGRELLDIRQNNQRLYKSLSITALLLATAGIGILLYNILQFDYQLQQQFYIYSRSILLPVCLFFLVWIIIHTKSPVKWFFVTGSSFIFLGGLIAVMLDPKSSQFFDFPWSANPIIFFKSGILLESLCFAMAMGYRFHLIRKEKENASNAYISQLELNREMAKNEKERLELMVSERTHEVIEKNKLLESQKALQLKAAFEKQLAEMEMRALRSQMNPHFIFNSLNSIRYEILRQHYNQAADYLTRFSKLLRYILQNSREHTVSLEEEITMNRHYVRLESLRFSHELDFQINIANDIDLKEIMVPPMLLQPYVENAVRHGLVPSQKKVKRLIIGIDEVEDGYHIIIEDNGVGREASKNLKENEYRKSLGMEIAGERIQLFNLNYPFNLQVAITDLWHEGIPEGTRVTITYKIL
jgi:hypothetical protein